MKSNPKRWVSPNLSRHGSEQSFEPPRGGVIFALREPISRGLAMKKVVFVGSLLSVLLATVAYTYDIRHPNLRDAYGAAEQAIKHIHEAQQANKGIEFGGHAEKALDLLKQAQTELVEGDKYNNAHHR
jgi:hypothetical protein